MKKLSLIAFLLLFNQLGMAHPLAPGLLTVTQQNETNYLVTWKTPLRQTATTRMTPKFPPQCKMTNDETLTLGIKVVGTGKVQSWQIQCGAKSLIGEKITIDGLDSTQAGVLLRMQLSDGRHYHKMLNAAEPSFIVPAKKDAISVFTNYMTLGFEHLISGIDHVLFVITLTLLVGWGRKLFWTITLFTIGHSITLVLAVLGYVHFPATVVEALIALSIMIAAVELLHKEKQTLFRRLPWLMSGSFGLLHGMGFAGALSDIGLPEGEIPLSLAAFNIGIEFGQLAIVAVFLIVLQLLKHQIKTPLTQYRWLTAYAIGTVGAFWFWDRLGVFEGTGLL